MRIVPDIVLEVVSPNDLAGEVQAKVCEYQGVGVPIVWLVFPTTRTVYFFRHGSKLIDQLGSGDTLTGDDVLPGFSVPVADLFPPVATQPQAAP